MIYDFPATFVYEMFTPPLNICVGVGALYIFNSHLSACLSPAPHSRPNIFDDYAPFSLSCGAEGDWRRRRRRIYILLDNNSMILWNTQQSAGAADVSDRHEVFRRSVFAATTIITITAHTSLYRYTRVLLLIYYQHDRGMFGNTGRTECPMPI